MSDDKAEAILEEIRGLRQELRDVKAQVAERDELPRLQDFADELGIARSTLYDKLNRRGIPIRDSHGYPKEEGDRSAAHVSRTEWEEGEEIATRTVRERAGAY